MLRSSFGGFMTAQSAITAFQSQLSIAGHNIANVATRGYTRQSVDLYSSKGLNSLNIGGGVTVGGVSQFRDPFLDARYRNEVCKVDEYREKLGILDDLDNILGELDKDGLGVQLSEFITQLRKMIDPTSGIDSDSIAKSSADSMVKIFNAYANQIKAIKDRQLENLKDSELNTVNDLMKNIAELNKSIKNAEASGLPALELRDDRNLLLDKLGSYVNIDVKYTPKEIAPGVVVNDVDVRLKGADGSLTPLIQNDKYAEFTYEEKADGTLALLLKSSDGTISSTVDSINGIMDKIDKLNNALPNYQQALNDIATSITNITTQITNTNTQITAQNGVIGGIQSQIDWLKNYIADPTSPPALVAEKKQELYQKQNDLRKEEGKLSSLNKTLRDQNTELSNAQSSQRYTQGSFDTAQKEQEQKIDKLKESFPPPSVIGFSRDANGLISDVTVTTPPGAPVKLMDSGVNKPLTEGKNAVTGEKEILVGGAGGPDVIGILNPGTGKNAPTDITSKIGTGVFKASLDMINSAGEFDTPPSTVKGIAFYNKSLDTLAGVLADKLNTANSYTNQEMIDLGITGPQSRPLFESSDGGPITAANIKLAQGWVNSDYSITATKEVSPGGDNTGATSNIQKMINLMSADTIDFKTPDQVGPPLVPGTTIYKGTMQKYLTNTANILNNDRSSTESVLENYTKVAEDVSKSRSQITDVSMNEETANMMMYQKSLSAAIRLMTTMDEAVDSIINKMGIVGR